jgi:hypothetical protein
LQDEKENMIPGNPRIGFIGFGEVAYYFAMGFKEDGVLQVSAFHSF